jgi:hypothetical protein
VLASRGPLSLGRSTIAYFRWRLHGGRPLGS